MIGPQDPPGQQNPYAPPSPAAADWSPGQETPDAVVQSSAPKTFGVLSIVFASLMLLVGLMQSCSGLAAPVMSSVGDLAPSTDPNAAKLKEVMNGMAAVYVAIGIQGIVILLMSALLLAIGIGQVRYRRWAGRWSVYWASAALMAVAGMVALAFLLIGPAYQRMMQTVAQAAPSGAIPSSFGSSLGSLMGGGVGIMMIFFYAPYPILLLIFFTRDRVRASMNS
jgi:hypothetical protein